MATKADINTQVCQYEYGDDFDCVYEYTMLKMEMKNKYKSSKKMVLFCANLNIESQTFDTKTCNHNRTCIKSFSGMRAYLTEQMPEEEKKHTHTHRRTHN